MKIRSIFFGVLLLSVTAPSSLFAQSIYSWVDESGVTHYTTKEIPGGKRAELPPIMKGEVKLTGKEALNTEHLTCDMHGGIDCTKGSDKDGSVICLDGYTESVTRFLFSCSSPKLRLIEIGKLDQGGDITVHVRNESSIVAKKPTIWITLKDGSQHRLFGSDSIGPYELAEFVFSTGASGQVLEKPEIKEAIISCANCN